MTSPGTERAGTVLEPSLNLESRRRRDALFDAIRTSTGNDNAGKTMLRTIGVATADIREAWPEGDSLEDIDLMREVAIRCSRYSQRFPGAQLTPMALAKWWGVLANSPLVSDVGRTDALEEIVIPPPLEAEELAESESARAEAFDRWHKRGAS